MGEQRSATISADDLFREFESDPDFRAALAVTKPKTDLAINVNRLRRERGLTQAQLARTAGMHQPKIAQIEGGDANPNLETIAKLAHALGVTVETLFADPDASHSGRDVADTTARATGPKLRIVRSREEWREEWGEFEVTTRARRATDPWQVVADDNYSLSA